MTQNKGLQIVGLGEAVFDIFEEETILGGAPLNVAVCAHQCIAAAGGAGIVASRVGRDALGRQLIRDYESRHMETRYIQIDDDRPTGKVLVSMKGNQPDYEICKPAAWDALQMDGRWVELASHCDAVCFGTLAQRSAVSREAIERFLTAASGAVRLLDINLRQDFYSPSILDTCLQWASAAKLNEEELGIISPLLNLETSNSAGACTQLLQKYELNFVALTRGEQGIELHNSSGMAQAPATSYPEHPHADSVGAGDAAAVGLMIGTCLGCSSDETLELAAHLGGYLASVPGATPKLPAELIRRVGLTRTD